MIAGGVMKKGLVLEGGAMRGIFTVGILDAMMENNIDFDGIIGVSAGAAFGCNFKSKQKGRALRYNKKYCRDKRYCSYWSLFKIGDLFGADFCYHELPAKLDHFDIKTFEENPQEFYLVCTDIETGNPFYYKCQKADDECFEYMRSSASMPLVSNIVEVGGRKFLDGALTDSVPLAFFESIGYKRNIVILTQPAGYVKKQSSAMALLRIVYRKYPTLVKVMENRHIMYNKQIEYIEKQSSAGNILLLRPEEKLPISRICHDPDLLQKTYDTGFNYALRNMNKIKDFLKNG